MSLFPGEPGLSANLWARGRDLLLAVYAHEAPAGKSIQVRFNSKVLQEGGVTLPTTLNLQVIGKDGYPARENDFEYRAPEITGTLGEDDLLLVSTPEE
jgi:hypothetical protein